MLLKYAILRNSIFLNSALSNKTDSALIQILNSLKLNSCCAIKSDKPMKGKGQRLVFVYFLVTKGSQPVFSDKWALDSSESEYLI